MAEQIKKNVPEIRFKGFSGEWEEKTIGEVFCEKRRLIALEDNELYELVTVKRRNGGVVSRGHLKGKDILVKNYSQLKAGDYIISKRQVVHGATGIVPEELNNAIVSNEYLVSVGNENSTAEFLAIISTLPDMYQKFFLSSYGVDIEKLFFDVDDWKKRNVVIPQLPEQNKICSYFNELDRVIGLHQRKHEKLVTLKKAMLKKMFPQNGATTPEIRFKGFSKPWNKKTFGDIFDFERPDKYIVKSDGYSDDFSTPVLTANKTFVLGYTNEQRTFDKPSVIFDDFTLDCKYVEFPFMVKSSALKILTIKHENIDDLRFAFNLLHTTKIEIMGHARHYIGVVQPTSIFTPVLDEQQKIGTYFRQLDELIEQHRTQVDKLKQLKTACLEKMFV